jgi:hypothetical protein
VLEYSQFLLVLGVESILPITMPFHAKPGCPKHLVDVYEKVVNAQPASYLLPPVTGEVFTSIAACEARLRGFALAEGFDIVQTGAGNKRVPSARWLCSHHGVETRNWRKLEDRIEYDEEGGITTRRQREGASVGQLACDWAVRVSWKDVGRRGSGTKAFVMSVNCLEHSHELAINPLSFPRHREAPVEYQTLVRTARKRRIAVISYSASRRVLEAEELGLVLTSREYYNLKPEDRTYMTTNIYFQHCVVIGMDSEVFAKDANRTYHILLVRKLCLENQYERVGVGKIKSSCVSKEYCSGELS